MKYLEIKLDKRFKDGSGILVFMKIEIKDSKILPTVNAWDNYGIYYKVIEECDF